jgi:hypothetical protein
MAGVPAAVARCLASGDDVARKYAARIEAKLARQGLPVLLTYKKKKIF